MNAKQNGFCGGWRHRVVLLIAAGVVLALGVSGLFADGPDSTKQGLREGVFVPRDTAKRSPSPVALEALQRLNENSVKKWSVDWDQGSGLPHWMGGLTDKKYAGQPSDAAKAFALEHLNLLTGIVDSQALANYSIEILNAKSFNIFTMVGLQVYYKGVKIQDGMLSVDVSNDNRIGSITNSLRPIQLDNVTPTLSKVDAEEIIRRLAAPDTAETGDGKMELVIYPSSPARLAYVVYRRIRGNIVPLPWQIILDARTGDLISATCMATDGPRSKQRHPQGEATRDSVRPNPARQTPRWPVYPLPGNDTLRPPAGGKQSRPGGTNRDSLILPPNWPGPQLDTIKKSSISCTRQYPQSCCYFYDPTIWFSSFTDEDQDGYNSNAYIEFNPDTDWDSAYVIVWGYGHAEQGPEYQLFEFGPYWIWGTHIDNWAKNFFVPFKGHWTFRLVLTDQFGGILDTYPDGSDPSMSNVPMESRLEDLTYVFPLSYHPYTLPEYDQDNDSFPQLCYLAWYTYVGLYDTTGRLPLTMRIYGRDSAGVELYLGGPDTFRVKPGQTEGWWTSTPAGHHGLWDLRLELFNPFGEVSALWPYGQGDSLNNVRMELACEDPPVTVVFDPNPVNSLCDESIRDSADWMYAVSPLAYRPVTLAGLNAPQSGFYWLTGQYVKIVEDSGAPYCPLAKAPQAGGPVFPYYRSDKQFEQVMCYYHIDRCQRHLQSLGFDSAGNYQIPVDAHGLDTLDNSRYVTYVDHPGHGWILFGDGGVDDAEDADIILHEYGHAIQDNQAPGIYTLGHGWQGHGNETSFMMEGFGDYWSSSCTDSASLVNNFPSGWLGEWDAKGYVPPGPFLRLVDNSKVYPGSIQDTTNFHENGLIWAGALWDIFQQYGKHIADSLVLTSHELMRNTPNPTFLDGARKILAADSAGYGAAHSTGLQTIFTNRGILSACNCGRIAGVLPSKMWADVSNDVAIGPPDVVRMVKYVYQGWASAIIAPPGTTYPNAPLPPVPPFTCQFRLGDANRDGTVGPPDVVRYVKYVYQTQTTAILDNPCQGGMEESERSPSPIAGGPAD